MTDSVKGAVALLKEKATNKKGRGFKGKQNTLDELQSLEDSSRVPYDVVKAETRGLYQKSVEGWIVFISNVHEECQEDFLVDKFSEFGQVRNVHLNLDRHTGYVKGYALLEYEKFEEAKEAVDTMNGKELYDKQIAVDFAFRKGALM
ncbi:hypothetical protein MP638_007070 [Amoeboaphelidium occidentale]|nr:hypothetical protein MP638_007070 [Amoeboaphelidium occidentale]